MGTVEAFGLVGEHLVALVGNSFSLWLFRVHDTHYKQMRGN